MARARGIYKKLGGDPRTIRSTAMKTITAAAKKLISEALGEEGERRPGLAWFVAIRLVAPIFWSITKERGSMPSVDEVVATVKTKYRDYAERLKAAYGITRATA